MFQSSLSNTEDECGHLKEMCENSQTELQELAEKHQEQLQEMNTIKEKLEVCTQNHYKLLSWVLAVPQNKGDCSKNDKGVKGQRLIFKTLVQGSS